jgi:glycerophosphoryl diester phosphodiesterase
VIAHRGDSFHAPENTLIAGLRAHQAGADAWEIDVRLTRDGVPVVIHDESLERTTDVERRFAGDPREHDGFLVADFDYDEIESLDAGSWFLADSEADRTAAFFGTLAKISEDDRRRFLSGEVRVPKLWEALKLTSRLDWAVNIELKSVPTAEPKLASAVLDVIRWTETQDRVLISSFDHTEVARVAHAAPELATAVLSTMPLQRAAEYCRALVGADAYHLSTDAIGANSSAYRRSPCAASLRSSEVAELKAAGLAVSVFTVNEHVDGGLADHLIEAGVTGLFTDHPAGLARHWGARKVMYPH